MSIESKVRRIEHLFDCLDSEISQFQSLTTLHCVSGCGKCCNKADLEASPLEFLPWAFQLFLNKEAETTLAELNNRDNAICYIYQPLSVLDSYSGSCGNYKYRGLICRLFGYAATKDKFGQLRLATCKIIKDNQNTSYNNAVTALQNGMNIPVFTDYYMKLSQIDFRLGNTILPVNKALKVAIEEVLHYYTYRPFPRKYKKAS